MTSDLQLSPKDMSRLNQLGYLDQLLAKAKHLFYATRRREVEGASFPYGINDAVQAVMREVTGPGQPSWSKVSHLIPHLLYEQTGLDIAALATAGSTADEVTQSIANAIVTNLSEWLTDQLRLDRVMLAVEKLRDRYDSI